MSNGLKKITWINNLSAQSMVVFKGLQVIVKNPFPYWEIEGSFYF